MAGQDGMSTSRQKRGGGIFNSEIRIVLKHDSGTKSIESIRREFANMARASKRDVPEYKFRAGIAAVGAQLENGWKRATNQELRRIMVRNTSLMKEDMISFSRRDTGLMRKSVRGRTISDSRGHVSRIGWIDIWYKYFGFQEEGTANGIKPMRALNRTLARGQYRLAADMVKFSNSITSQFIKDNRR